MTDIVGTDKVQDALLTNTNAAIGSVDDAESGHTDLDTRLDAMDALLAAASDDGYYSACTSSTRPAFASIDHGHLIGETDTGNLYLADKSGTLGTAERWAILSNVNSYLTAGLPTTGTTFTVLKGTRAKEVTAGTVIAPTTWREVEWNGTSWVSPSAIVAKAADYSITAADFAIPRVYTNDGASGQVNFSLPAGATGYQATFIVTDAQYLKITADGTEKFRFRSEQGAAGGYIRSNTVGTSWTITWTADDWLVSPLSGVLKYDE